MNRRGFIGGLVASMLGWFGLGKTAEASNAISSSGAALIARVGLEDGILRQNRDKPAPNAATTGGVK